MTKNDEQLEKEAKEEFIQFCKAFLLLALVLLVIAGMTSIPWWITGISKGVKLISSIMIFGILYLGMGKNNNK